MSTKKKVRKLNGKSIALLAFIIMLATSIYKVPHFINTNKLESMGYSSEAISSIYSRGLRKTILKNDYYSDYLNSEIVKDNFNEKYLRLYLIADYLDDSYFDLYENLKAKKGYSDEELEQLYASLKIYDLSPLIVFEKLDSIEDYVNDCLNHENSATSFKVSGDYLKPYENYKTVADPSLIDTYVSVKSYIGEYEPSKLVEIDSLHAVPNVLLESRAQDAFTNMCLAIRAEDIDMRIYATRGYVSYETQKNLFTDDSDYVKAGFCDDQTGLAVRVVATENATASAFKDCKVYSWLLEHAHEYGFIQRYPEGKEALTGHSFESNYFRYVGVDLATKIHDSGMCFDEYYANYIKQYN